MNLGRRIAMSRSWLLFCCLGVIVINSVRGQVLPLLAGFRASRILSNYPNQKFPTADYWVQTGMQMASKFAGAKPASFWIVSLYISGGTTQLNFPSPGVSHPYIEFVPSGFGDENEEYLARFDSAGFNVWLQVEPGAASIDTLIDIVLERYKHHSCVAGFGIDVEWLNAETYSGGRKLTDSNEVKRWEQRVRSHGSSYTLFLKHYAPAWMPARYRGSVLFVDDSQEFVSLGQMVNEFRAWGATFAPNPVAFQFGYPVDTVWWKAFGDPPKAIGEALLGAGISNLNGLFWVDFTITRVFPLTDVRRSPSDGFPPREAFLAQNYPNPFNPSTTIKYELPKSSIVKLSVHDILGRELSVLVNERKNAGVYHVKFEPAGLPSGVYFYRLQARPLGDGQAGDFIQTRRMFLIR